LKQNHAGENNDPSDDYPTLLKSVLRLFAAIIDRKEDEARENERFLGTIGPNEEQILISFKKHEE
jgi:hypothetical protein